MFTVFRKKNPKSICHRYPEEIARGLLRRLNDVFMLHSRNFLKELQPNKIYRRYKEHAMCSGVWLRLQDFRDKLRASK